MTPLRKLAVAAHTVGFAVPTSVMAFLAYEQHPGAVALTVSLVAGAAGVVALSAADQHAEEVARLAAQAAVGPAPEPWADPSAMDAAVAAYDRMRTREATWAPEPVHGEAAPYDANGEYDEDFVWDGTFTPEALAQIDEHRARYPEVYPAASEPAADVTQWDMAPAETTRQIPPVQPALWTPPTAPAAPWSATGVAFMAVDPRAPRVATHAKPDRVTDDWFRKAADRQERAGRAA